MSESQAEAGPSAATMPTVAPSTTHSAAPASSGKIRALAVLALLLGIAALALSGWQWWQLHEQGSRIDARLAPLQAELRELKAEYRAEQQSIQRSRDTELGQLRAEDARLAQSLDRQMEESQALAAQLAELNRVDRRLWQLAEAEYLLQLAQQRLRTGADADATLDLLRQADRILRDRRDPDLYPVREALAREIAVLEAVPRIDVDGLYLRLEALSERAAALPLVPDPKWQAPAPAETAAEGGWQQRLEDGFAAAWDKFSSYIRIRQRDQPLEPLLEPPVERALRLNLELLTEQAQLALLAGNSELFRHSLGRAIDWLERHYRVEPQATAALVSALRQLADTPISAELPELGAARRALAAWLDARYGGSARGEAAPDPVEAEGAQP